MKTKTILTLPVCIIVICMITFTDACSAPVSVSYSTRSPIKSTYATGDVLTIVCNTCYKMTSGNSSLTCQSSGIWLGTLPVCTELPYLEGPHNFIQKLYKSITSSSLWSADYTADKAVDGSMATLAHTQSELHPWIKLQFCVSTAVTKVIMWSRATCCDEQMANIDIKLDGTLCGHVEGPVEQGRSVEVSCLDPSTGEPLSGEFLTFQRMTTDILSLTEIEVLGGEMPCSPPEAIEHSSYSPVKTIYHPGDVIDYKCDSCHYLTSGNISRTCIYPGKWSALPPVCSERTPYIPEQNENIATEYNYKSVSQSSEDSNERPAELAVDGSMALISVTNTQQFPWWRLELCSPMTMSLVRIWNRADCCEWNLDNTNVFIDNVLCGSISSVAKGSSIDVTCTTPLIGGPMAGKVLKIQRDTTANLLNLAEVQVYGFNACPALHVVPHSTKNLNKTYYSSGDTVIYKCDGCFEKTLGDLTLHCTETGTWDGSQPVCTAQSEPAAWDEFSRYHRTATQSSVDEDHNAYLALDDSLDTLIVTNNEYNAWWSVELCSQVLVDLVYIYNRKDCCADELDNFDVTVDSTACGHASGPIGLGAHYRLDCPGNGLYGTTVKIQKPSTLYESLAFSEVKIYSYPWVN